MDKLAILIPCYNEAQTIGKVVKDCLAATQAIPGTVVYVYDNNSQDDTVKIAQAAGAVFVMNTCKEKGMSFGGCFVKSTPSAM